MRQKTGKNQLNSIVLNFNQIKAGFYLRKKVAGSTLKIKGSIFRAKPRMRGPKTCVGGEPERGGVPPLGGGGVSRKF